MGYQVREIELTEESIEQILKAMGTEKILVVYNEATQDAILCGSSPYKENDQRDAKAIADLLNHLNSETVDGPPQAT